jgi:hypothetical protein
MNPEPGLVGGAALAVVEAGRSLLDFHGAD